MLSPLQNTASPYFGNFVQVRPRITQEFGGNKETYDQFGLDGHDGIDFGTNGDDSIFAPFSGYVKLKNSGDKGYGLHIKIRDSKKECVLGHLARVFITDGQFVHLGDKIAVMGDSGFSSAKHLHFGLRYLVPGDGDRFSLAVTDYNNGFFGYVDPLEFMVTWKGGFKETTFK